MTTDVEYSKKKPNILKKGGAYFTIILAQVAMTLSGCDSNPDPNPPAAAIIEEYNTRTTSQEQIQSGNESDDSQTDVVAEQSVESVVPAANLITSIDTNSIEGAAAVRFANEQFLEMEASGGFLNK